MAHHIIFVPGIGDHRALGQDKGIAWWSILGVKPHYHPVGWADSEPWQSKLDKLLAEIDGYRAAGDYVSLLGFSAGASAVINAFAARKGAITAVICISGKINHPAAAQNYFQTNNAFQTALYDLQANVAALTPEDKRCLLTLNPLRDEVVPYKDAVIPGVNSWRIFALNHVMAIITGLTLYALPLIIHCKRLQKQITNV